MKAEVRRGTESQGGSVDAATKAGMYPDAASRRPDTMVLVLDKSERRAPRFKGCGA